MTISFRNLCAALMLSGAATLQVSASVPGAGGLETRPGVPVSYGEDSFRDIASRRFDRSPFYRSISAKGDSVSVNLPAAWRGLRIVLGLDYNAVPKGDKVSVAVNGHPLSPVESGRSQWDITPLLTDGSSKFGIKIDGLGDRKREMYMYATPQRVYVDNYSLSTRLQPATNGKPAGIISLDIDLGGITRPTKDISFEYMLFDDTRHQVAAGRADAAPHLTFKATVPNINPWNNESPRRYMVALILRDDRTGAHIQTVGTPIRFADLQTIESGGVPIQASLSGQPVVMKLALLDSVPSLLPDREKLAAQLHAGGANMVASPWADPAWVDLCEFWGLTAVDNADIPAGSLDSGFQVDGSDSRWSRLMKAFLPVTASVADIPTLDMRFTNRNNYTPLDSYLLDWELVDFNGVTLGGAKGVTVAAEPGQTASMALLANSPLPPGHPEALLNLSWRRASDGTRIAAEQIEIDGTPHNVPALASPQKLKSAKGKYQAKRTTLAAQRDGRLDLLDLQGWETDIAGIGPRLARSSLSYNSKQRVLKGDGVTYAVDNDGSLWIDPSGQTITMTIPGDLSERILYMGRGPWNSPADSDSKAWISLNRSTPAAERDPDGTVKRHSDARYLILSDSQGKAVLRIDSDKPFEFSASAPAPGADVTLTLTPAAASSLHLSSLR